MKDFVDCVPQKGPIGKKFRAQAKAVAEALAQLPADQVEALEKGIADNG